MGCLSFSPSLPPSHPLSTRIAGQPFTFTVGIGEVIAGQLAGIIITQYYYDY